MPAVSETANSGLKNGSADHLEKHCQPTDECQDAEEMVELCVNGGDDEEV
jgi:hypothetical protein